MRQRPARLIFAEIQSPLLSPFKSQQGLCNLTTRAARAAGRRCAATVQQLCCLRRAVLSCEADAACCARCREAAVLLTPCETVGNWLPRGVKPCPVRLTPHTARAAGRLCAAATRRWCCGRWCRRRARSSGCWRRRSSPPMRMRRALKVRHLQPAFGSCHLGNTYPVSTKENSSAQTQMTCAT